jgi:hypothetical protein
MTSTGGQGNKRARPMWRRGLMITAQLLLGLGLGAVIAEIVFMQRDDGAFPHVNFYVPDPELGVRLEPGASMRFQLRENPLTTIRVNSRGFRGGEWSAPGDHDVIVVGDSQVFGLGVEDDATFSAGLAARSGRPVLNAGVPTYGPQEYLATARELLAERRATTVVVALNFVNDPFEIDRPNRERHAVWDGWAVRSETAPAEVAQFPGRRWLFSRSHAVYALRRWLHERGTAKAPEGDEQADPVDLGTPSEGGLHDLVSASQSAHAAAASARQEAEKALATSQQRLLGIDGDISSKRDALDQLVYKASEYEFDSFQQDIARGRPGDIVREDYGEASRSVSLTAAMIRDAARKREAHLKALLLAEQRKGKSEAKDLLKAEETLVAERQALRLRIAAGVPEIPRPPSLFHAYLQEFKALCEQHGAELVVVALPIDVQVSRDEWAKYGVTDAPDMSDSLVLIDDLIADAGALGLRALDATAVLRAAEPGAFLDHDIHMTAKGHAALAEALTVTLGAPPVTPLRRPAPGLPEGRSFVPTDAEWRAAGEISVAGSSAAGCTTQIVREWLRVQCRRKKLGDRFDALELREGQTPATMLVHTTDALSLVTPMTIGAPITAHFHWKGKVRELAVRWPAGVDGKPRFVGTFTDLKDVPPRLDPLAPAIAALCNCHNELTVDEFCADPQDTYDCPNVCSQLWGDPRLDAACSAAFPACKDRLACVQNDPVFAPKCPEGQVHAFASNACFAVCDPAHPCTAGKCEDWQGSGVCV